MAVKNARQSITPTHLIGATGTDAVDDVGYASLAEVKAGLSLDNVDNTSDANKAISTATQAALDSKQPIDSDLTAIAALSTTAFGRDLLTRADDAAVRSYIGAGTSSFSGAYPDLTSKPTIPFGFTYDQTTEPVSPTVGQTWRDAEGEIWQWDGTYWERPFTECLPIFYWSSLSSQINNLVSPISFSAKILGYTLITALINAPQDASNNWTFRGIASQTDYLNTSDYPDLLINSGTIITELVSPPEILLSSDADIVFTSARLAKNGEPGNLRRGHIIVNFRRIRA